MFDGGDPVARMAEAKIQEAIRNGEFDNLPGQGKPLQLQDLSLVPEELRAGYILLQNAGFLPEELELHQEIVGLQNLVSACTREEEKVRLRLKLLDKTLRYELLMARGKRKAPPRGPSRGPQLPRRRQRGII